MTSETIAEICRGALIVYAAFYVALRLAAHYAKHRAGNATELRDQIRWSESIVICLNYAGGFADLFIVATLLALPVL